MFNWLGKKKAPQQTQVQQEPVAVKSREQMEMEMHLNNLVICVSNEVENITVGYAKEIIFLTKAKQPFLIVHDIVNNREIMPMGTIYTYTEQKFNALNNMEPNERIALIYARYSDEEVNKSPAPDEVLYSPEEWKQKVDAAVNNWRINKALTMIDNIQQTVNKMQKQEDPDVFTGL
jgi:hypothetical protein